MNTGSLYEVARTVVLFGSVSAVIGMALLSLGNGLGIAEVDAEQGGVALAAAVLIAKDAAAHFFSKE